MSILIRGMFDNGAMPTLQRTVQFTNARHNVLTNNIANLSTPNFRPRDLGPEGFRAQLRDAIDRRRRTARPISGELQLKDSREIRFHEHSISTRPEESNQNILFHDRNNRDLERTMQHLAENTMVHNAAIDMLRNEFDLLRVAIRERL